MRTFAVLALLALLTVPAAAREVADADSGARDDIEPHIQDILENTKDLKALELALVKVDANPAGLTILGPVNRAWCAVGKELLELRQCRFGCKTSCYEGVVDALDVDTLVSILTQHVLADPSINIRKEDELFPVNDGTVDVIKRSFLSPTILVTRGPGAKIGKQLGAVDGQIYKISAILAPNPPEGETSRGAAKAFGFSFGADKSIAEIITGDRQLAALLAALVKAELTGVSDVTVLAPVNYGFCQLGKQLLGLRECIIGCKESCYLGTVEALDVDTLTAVLLQHVSDDDDVNVRKADEIPVLSGGVVDVTKGKLVGPTILPQGLAGDNTKISAFGTTKATNGQVVKIGAVLAPNGP